MDISYSMKSIALLNAMLTTTMVVAVIIAAVMVALKV
jgi:hypothetical protein